MDSLIHYRADDVVRARCRGSPARTARSIVFTFAPRTPADLMHAVGRLFPRGDRAPAIEPVAEAGCAQLMRADRLAAVAAAARVASPGASTPPGPGVLARR
jgi:magnesium-protoporphyrin O-methyltransferase